MNLLYNCIVAFAMYSKIPMPMIEWTKERMRYVFCFFPLIGLPIGFCMYLWMRFGILLTGSGMLHSAVLVLIPVIITGGIHLDGFLDTSDALSSFKTMEEKLEILKDSHAGAFAIIMGCCYFTLNFGACSSLTLRAVRLLAVGYVLSRSMSGLAVVTFKKAKNSGLLYAFSDSAQAEIVKKTMIAYIILCGILLILMDPIPGICVYVCAWLTFFWYRQMAYKKFGGITGDLAGFFLQIVELAMMVVAVCVIQILS